MSNGRTKVVGYARVSTDKQVDGGVSLDVQREKIQAYCLAMDLDLVAIIEDAGASAKSLDRAGLRSALAMLTSGKADALLVTKLDRLTRSVRDLGDLVERYFATKCSLVSMNDSIDTRTASGRLILNVLTSVAQWEREATGERTRDALRHMKANGEYCGGNVAYGFSVANGELVRNEAEQLIISAIQDFKAAGLSDRGIAAELDRAGLAPRKAKKWGHEQIRRILAA